MPLIIPEDLPILFVYDMKHQNALVSIYFNTRKEIVDIIKDGANVDTHDVGLTPLKEALKSQVLSRIHAVDATPSINPAEILRREVAAQKERPFLSTICRQCPVACTMRIYYSKEGKLLDVEGNACERGLEFAKGLRTPE
jgi:hypothetical protein